MGVTRFYSLMPLSLLSTGGLEHSGDKHQHSQQIQNPSNPRGMQCPSDPTRVPVSQ